MDIWITIATILLVLLAIWLSSSSKLMDSNGLVVFISGCDTGIGHRLAIYFSDLGCDVFAGCLDPDTARPSLPASVRIVPLDVTNADSVRMAVDYVRTRLEEEKKDLWALINNAGVCVCGYFEWQTWKQCERQVQVNVLGTMRLTKAFVPLLRKLKGRIVTVSSVNGSITYPGLSVYSATKFALEGLNHGLRLELGSQHGIRVITIQPGDYARVTSIMSQHRRNAQDMWDEMSEEDRERYGKFFHKYHRLTLKNYGLTSPCTFEGSNILRDMENAVLSENPADKYISAPLVHKLFYRLLALSPSKLTDQILGKIMEIMFNSDEEKQD